MIDLGDLVPDHKVDQSFVIHNIQQLKWSALHYFGTGFLYIRGKNMITQAAWNDLTNECFNYCMICFKRS